MSGNLEGMLEDMNEVSPNYADRILRLLNLGMVHRIQGNYQKSILAWERAKQRIAELRPASITEVTASFLLNDNTKSFIGSYQEQQWLHIFQALNYIDINRPDGARVELLQADQLHKEYGKGFLEPPFMRYLSGMTFEHLGEYDQALVAYKRALDLYPKFATTIPSFLYADTARMLLKLGLTDEFTRFSQTHNISDSDLSPPNVTLVWVQGLVSQKREKRLTHWAPRRNRSFSLAMPYYPRKIITPSISKLTIDSGTSLSFAIAARVDTSIRQEFAATEKILLTKTIARQVLKAQLSDLLLKGNAKNNRTVQLVSSLFNVLTESADLRSWNSLPYRVLIYRGNAKLGTWIKTEELPESTALRISNDKDRIFRSFFRLF